MNTIKWLKENDPMPEFLKAIKGVHAGDESLVVAHIASGHSVSLANSVDPLHIYTIGTSGKGKGHVANSVLSLFSDEVKVPLASFSPKVFYYASKDMGFDQKIVHAPELTVNEKDEDKLALLRILTDSPSNNLKPEHWTLNERREAVKLRIDGRIVFWFNSETPLPDKQLKNRVLLGNPDESSEQDEKVYSMQAEKQGLLIDRSDNEQLKFCRDLNSAILIERGYEVFVPFTKLIEFTAKENRRLFPMFMTLLKSITKINCFRRKKFTKVGDGKSTKFLVAMPEDFEVAAWAWNSLFPVTVGQVSTEALKLLERIPLERENAATKDTLGEECGFSSSWAYKKATELYNAGLVNSEKIDRKYFYWRTRTALTELGIRAKWQNFDNTKQLEAFQLISYSKSEEVAVKKFCEECHTPPDPSPSWLKHLKSANSVNKQRINSDAEMSQSSQRSNDQDLDIVKVYHTKDEVVFDG